MYDFIEALAREHGFAKAYFLAPVSLPLWQEQAARQNTLCGMMPDTARAFPRARCIVLLVKRYAPYSHSRVLPYYIAENEAYFAARAFCEDLRRTGAYAESVWLPARALAVADRVGVQGKNGLLTLEDMGSRISLFTAATDAVAPLSYDIEGQRCPDGCHECMRACPAGAIGQDGLNVTRCLRYHMNTPLHPAFVLEKLTAFLGCDVCQAVCPKNADVPCVTAPADVERAFDLLRLIGGDTREARGLAGRNMTGGGKLSAEAIAFAARERLFEDEIRLCLASDHDAVRQTASWALGRYFD